MYSGLCAAAANEGKLLFTKRSEEAYFATMPNQPDVVVDISPDDNTTEMIPFKQWRPE
jgi:hypothetical protein